VNGSNDDKPSFSDKSFEAPKRETLLWDETSLRMAQLANKFDICSGNILNKCTWESPVHVQRHTIRSPKRVFTTTPNVGPSLLKKILDQLGYVETSAKSSKPR
jgi:hypothetical protein